MGTQQQGQKLGFTKMRYTLRIEIALCLRLKACECISPTLWNPTELLRCCSCAARDRTSPQTWVLVFFRAKSSFFHSQEWHLLLEFVNTVVLEDFRTELQLQLSAIPMSMLLTSVELSGLLLGLQRWVFICTWLFFHAVLQPGAQVKFLSTRLE